MKLLTILIISFGSLLSGETEPLTTRAEATHEDLIAAADYLSMEEKAMLWEINLVRTEPWTYIPHVEQELRRVMADSLSLSTIQSESIRRVVSSISGKEVMVADTNYRNYYADRVGAIRELLIELKTLESMSGLRPYRPLYDVAIAHGASQAEQNYIDHIGTDGSWPQDRILRANPALKDGNENILRAVGSPRDLVIQLLVDSGVDHRGHRRNILNPDWKYVSCHHVRQLDEASVRWWIQEFAY